MKTKTTQAHDLMETFLLASQIEGKNGKTIERYENILRPFLSHIGQNPLEIAPRDIRNYLGHLNNAGYAKATVWTAYKNLHVFYEFLRRDGYIKDNPMKLVAKPKMPKVFPKILTDDEIRALLFAAKSYKDKFLKRRNFALVCLLFDAGIRASELCGLKTGDVSLEQRLIKVFGKGSKERIIPFSDETAKTLSSYLKVRGSHPYEESFFVTQRGNAMTRHRVYRLIRSFAVKAKLDVSKVSPHVLQHSFATNWIRAGGDGKKLQALMGHADGRIVDVYIHLTGVDLAEAHSRYSPLKRIMGK